MKWTEVAWADLEASADYIARDSPHYAAAFVREMRDAARSLRSFAERGRAVPEIEDPSVRELLIGSYRMLYQMTAGDVVILGLIHGARDLLALWKRRGG